MFSLNGTLKKSGSVGRWETKQFIRMAFYMFNTVGDAALKKIAEKEIISMILYSI